MRKPQHIGLNAVFLRPKMGGHEAYVRYLIPELMALRPDWRFTLFVNSEGRDHLAHEPWSQSLTFVTHPLLGARYLTAISEATLLSRLAARADLDLLHSLAMTGPLRSPVPHVVTVPDLIWLHYPRSIGLLTSLTWRALVPAVARRADRVIAVSEATRADIVTSFKVPVEKIDVALHGPGEDPVADPTPEPELRTRYDLGTGPIVFAASSKRKHKNLMRLVHAIKPVRERFPDVVLVMPGSPTPHEAELIEAADRLGVRQNVRFPGFVDAQELEAFYRCSACFVYPSLCEGFGLPLLEAMRRNAPVACSNVSSLPEVAGDAARYFDPTSVDEIATAVIDLLTDVDLTRRLVAAGQARYAQFSWQAAAEATIASYERAVVGSK